MLLLTEDAVVADPEPPEPNPDSTPAPVVAAAPTSTGRVSWWGFDVVTNGRVGRYPSAVANQLGQVLDGVGSGTVTISLTDPCVASLKRADGQWCTSVNSGRTLQRFREGRCIDWLCITAADEDVAAGTVAFSVATWEQFMVWRVQGGANRRNLADLDNFDPMADNDCGKFDVPLTGWGTIGSATIGTVDNPVVDSGTARSAVIFPPTGGVVGPDVGMVRIVDVSHSFPGGIPHRFTWRYWLPVGGTGSGFYYRAACRLRYYPPDSEDFTVEEVFLADEPGLRSQWVHAFKEILIPPNDGGTLTIVLMPAEGSPDNPGAPNTVYIGSRWALVRDETFSAVNYERGDMVSAAVGRLVDEMSYAADDPYRGLQVSAPPLDEADGIPAFEDINPAPGLKRIHYRYEEVEHRTVWDIALELAKLGGCNVWISYGTKVRTLRCGKRGRYQPSYPLTVNGPRGFLTGWSPDGSKARSRRIVQSPDSEWSRAEGVAFGSDLPTGALVDEVTTAPDTSPDANLYELARDDLKLRGGVPQIMQFSLPGEAAGQVGPGDTFRVRVDDLMSTTGRFWTATSVAYDEVTDRVAIEVTDVLVDA